MPRKPQHKRLRTAIHQACWKDRHALVVELAREFLAHHPHDATVWISLGHALTKLSRYEEAECAFSVELAPGFEMLEPIFWRERGELERRRGRLHEAKQWFERALEADPHDVGLRVDLGYLALRLGDLEEAERHFRRDVEEGEFETKGGDWFRLGDVLLAQGRVEEALAAYREAAAFEPKARIAKTRIRELEQVLVLRLMNPGRT